MTNNRDLHLLQRCPTCQGTNIMPVPEGGFHCHSCGAIFLTFARKVSSPVHYNESDTTDWQGDSEPKGWYFWTETQADRIGPFDTEEQAEHMCVRYVREVLDGNMPDHELQQCKWCGGLSGAHVNDCK